MPRGPRLDAPGALHHVRVRGLDRQAIFRSDADREEFCARLARVHEAAGLAILAWALLPNHAHLLVRTGPQSLTWGMRRLLTGYATTFNRRHRRTGHLFQNRYKSILVQEGKYLVELVRHIHVSALLARCAQAFGVTPTVLRSGSRHRGLAHARAVAAYLAVTDLGIPIVQVARAELVEER